MILVPTNISTSLTNSVIGTWSDNKVLFQRTFIYFLSSANTFCVHLSRLLQQFGSRSVEGESVVSVYPPTKKYFFPDECDVCHSSFTRFCFLPMSFKLS
mmetsp:Transcript_2001/g.2096  ORF Transcript_2001/g.2096 Transcript_2001/m.2096 type:complete len:99 (+) Transcript_2001:387-683(+)